MQPVVTYELLLWLLLLLHPCASLLAAPDTLLLLQVTAEFKRANGLIKPGPKTIKVWAALYAEIEKVRGISELKVGVQQAGSQMEEHARRL